MNLNIITYTVLLMSLINYTIVYNYFEKYESLSYLTRKCFQHYTDNCDTEKHDMVEFLLTESVSISFYMIYNTVFVILTVFMSLRI